MCDQSQVSHTSEETSLRTSNTPGTCAYIPPVLPQEALTDSDRKIWYHSFPGFWNSGPFQTSDWNSQPLVTFENVALCNQRYRVSCDLHLCPQLVGKLGLHNFSPIWDFALLATPSFIPTKTEKLSWLAFWKRPESFWKLNLKLRWYLYTPVWAYHSVTLISLLWSSSWHLSMPSCVFASVYISTLLIKYEWERCGCCT